MLGTCWPAAIAGSLDSGQVAIGTRRSRHEAYEVEGIIKMATTPAPAMPLPAVQTPQSVAPGPPVPPPSPPAMPVPARPPSASDIVEEKRHIGRWIGLAAVTGVLVGLSVGARIGYAAGRAWWVRVVFGRPFGG